jgi:hypothetical protein
VLFLPFKAYTCAKNGRDQQSNADPNELRGLRKTKDLVVGYLHFNPGYLDELLRIMAARQSWQASCTPNRYCDQLLLPRVISHSPPLRAAEILAINDLLIATYQTYRSWGGRLACPSAFDQQTFERKM